MKRFILALLICLGFPFQVFAVNYPNPQNFVNDFASIFSSQFLTDTNQQLAGFKQQTGNEIAVVTVPSLEGLTVEEYAVKLFEKWGIGQKDKDNGLLLLIAPNERQVRIEVGYGLEGNITDGTAGYILDNFLIPDFKNGKYEVGVKKTLEKIETYLTDPSQIPSSNPSPDKVKDLFTILIVLFFTGIPIYLLSYMSRSQEIVTGGIVGAILGYLIVGLSLALVLGFFGLILDLILSRNYKRLKSLNLPTDFWRSRGGFGGGGGGGFGGFGGGSSGGGGASRGW